MPHILAFNCRLRTLGSFVFVLVMTAAAGAGSVTVPADVRIPVELSEQVTSLTSHVGDTFTFKTTQDEKLGDMIVPAGSTGHGRLAVVTPAREHQNGTLALQADNIDLPDGRSISVNVDPSKPMRGHLSNRHTQFRVRYVLVGVVPLSKTTVDGNMVLEPGTPFSVITTLPRSAPAPLMTAAPTTAPTLLPAPSPSR